MTLRIITCIVIVVCFAVMGSMLATALVKLLELSNKGLLGSIIIGAGVFTGGMGIVLANHFLFK